MPLRLGTFGLAFSLLACGGASAQDLPPLPDLQPAPQAQTIQASVLDEPIRQIADTAGGCAVLDKDFPGLRQHSMYDFFKSMSLNQVAALSKGQITPDMLAQAKMDLTALNAPTVSADGITQASATTVTPTGP